MTIISIPHSGTRALRDYLQVGPHCPYPKYFHFGITQDNRIFTPTLTRQGPFHIPIRNPIDIGVSWHARYMHHDPTKYKRPVSSLLRGFDQMFRFIKEYPNEITLWQMEVLPHLDSSKGPSSHVRKDHGPGKSPYVDAVRELLNERADIRNFYSQFYMPEHCPLPAITVAT